MSRLNRSDVERLILVIGISAVALGGLRVIEAVVFARVGPDTSKIFSQNVYGILFSSFTPFAVTLFFRVRSSIFRACVLIGLLILLLAIGVNGSRSSWLASAAGLAVLGGLFVVVQRRSLFSLAGLVGIVLLSAVILVSVLPPEVLAPISSRFATLENVDEDKSYATRELMQQKSLVLFEESPLFGVGRNQFRNASVQLDFSDSLFAPTRNSEFNQFASHNSYAQWLAESGLVGTIPFVLLLLLLLKDGIFVAIRLGRRGDLWALAIVAAFIAMSIHLWSIDNLKSTGAWLIYGLVAGMISYEHQNPVSADEE